ncbi:protein PLANT CADMIUM RESISTANCE 10 isoform X2 [Aristolochia californica]|uniref:protein PLANT CADMIUM RESISTANCE 10 isoform X2 n=1 Tax=Aristolochia californica TaxID=171875 RepID=UPI0035D55F1A
MKGQSGYTPPRYIPLDQTDLERETVPRSTVSSHQQVSHDPTQWSSGICACCDDMQSCCIGLFCPCVLFGKNAEFLGAESWTGPCMTHFILWGLVNGLCCMLTDGLLLGIPGSVVACYACGYRKSLRAKYNLQEAPCGDLTTHMCCHLCANCQEYREIRERSGNAAHSDLKISVVAPPVQTMETLPS